MLFFFALFFERNRHCNTKRWMIKAIKMIQLRLWWVLMTNKTASFCKIFFPLVSTLAFSPPLSLSVVRLLPQTLLMIWNSLSRIVNKWKMYSLWNQINAPKSSNPSCVGISYCRRMRAYIIISIVWNCFSHADEDDTNNIGTMNDDVIMMNNARLLRF